MSQMLGCNDVWDSESQPNTGTCETVREPTSKSFRCKSNHISKYRKSQKLISTEMRLSPRKSKCLLLLLLLGTMALGAASQSATSVKIYKDSEFIVVGETLKFADAKKACQSLEPSSTLARVSSEPEHFIVVDLLNKTSFVKNKEVYIGKPIQKESH